MSTRVIAPFGFFTYDAFKAGWYFLWRMCVYTLPAFVILLIGGAMMIVPFIAAGIWPGDQHVRPDTMSEITASGSFIGGAVLVFLGLLGGFIASIPLTSKIARSWAQQTWGRTFVEGVWRAMIVRVILVNILSSIVGKGANVALDALTADTASLGASLAGLFLSLVVLALNIVVSLLSYGWAMSHAVVNKLAGVGAATAVIAGLNPLGYAPTAGPQYTAPPRPAPVRPMPTAPMSGAPAPVVTPPVMTPRAPMPPPPPSSSGGVAQAGRRQCPKCDLYETEKGTVLGWYCKVCGWSESRA